MAHIERRKFFQIGMAALAGAVLPATRARAGGAGGFRFLVVNDLHYHDAECAPWFASAFVAMRASAPDAAFCLVAGDLANDGKPDQLEAVSHVIKAAAIPCHVVPGNHDWTSATDRSAYDKYFPAAGNAGFEHSGWRVIGLDTTENTAWQNTQISAGTLRWLDDHLAASDPAKPLILFTHFPLGRGVKFRPANADELLTRLAGQNLRAAFSGHWHGFTEWEDAGIFYTTNRCCSRYRDNHDGTPAKGWFVCEARDGNVSRRFVELPPELRTHGLSKA